MRSYLTLQKSKVFFLVKILRVRNFAKLFVIFSFLAIAIILGFATYKFSLTSLSFVRSNPEYSQLIAYYMLAITFFLIFILTLVSSVISAIGILFVQDDDDLLLSAPLGISAIFTSRLTTLVGFSAWPLLIFGIPTLLAFQQSFNLTVLNLALALTSLVGILVVSAFASAIVAITITSVSGKLGRKAMFATVFLLLPLLAWWMINTILPGNVNFLENVAIDQVGEYLQSLPVTSKVLPSAWAANTAFYWHQYPQVSTYNLAKLLILITVLIASTYWIVTRYYLHALAKARTGRFVAGSHDTKLISGKRKFPYLLRGITGTFLEKDLLTFARSQTEILQAGFIVFMIILYFFALTKIPLGKIGQALSGFSINYLIQLNFLVISFILAILALRFIFPSASLEGQSAWIVWVSPFSKAKLYWQKLFTGWGILSIISSLAVIISSLILKLPFYAMLVQIIVFIILSAIITTINLTLGIVFPNFEEKNPEKLSTSKGGLATTFLTLFYIFVVNGIIFTKTASVTLTVTSQFYFLSISILTFIILSLVSLRKIETYSF